MSPGWETPLCEFSAEGSCEVQADCREKVSCLEFYFNGSFIEI